MSARGREAKRLGKTLKAEPKSFPAEMLELIRRAVRTIWNARGGGLYACGFVVTFVYLEIRMFLLDIFEAESVGGFFTEQATEMLFKYLGESIQNTVNAFIWPVHVISIEPQPWGFVLLGVMYLVFANFLKRPLEGWLFGENLRETGSSETP